MRALSFLLMVCVVLAGAACAHVAHADATQARAKAKQKKLARHARSRVTRRANMPSDWTWPPSDKMRAEGERCLKDLDRLGVSWQAAKAEAKVATPIVVPDMHFGGVTLEPRWGKGPWVMDCHLARALARDVGPALANMHVATLRFGQIYKLRDVAGKPGVLSRHALGMAMDVTDFVSDDGTVHDVRADYLAGDEVLLEIERRVTDTGAFRALLTPGNDPKHHYDHFHFEARAEGDKVISPPTRAVAPVIETHADDVDTAVLHQQNEDAAEEDVR